ncbi:MAG: hypothetical protein AAF806_32710 [Bacteroidota bacterium]
MENITHLFVLSLLLSFCLVTAQAQQDTLSLEKRLENLRKEIQEVAAKNGINTEQEAVKQMEEEITLIREIGSIKRAYNQLILSQKDHYYTFQTNETKANSGHRSMIEQSIETIDTLIASRVQDVIAVEVDTFFLPVRKTYHVKLKVMGFASPDGPVELNLNLSKKRAESIASLLKDHTLNHHRFEVSYVPFGRGENVMYEMQALPNKYKRSVLVLVESIDIVDETALISTPSTTMSDLKK